MDYGKLAYLKALDLESRLGIKRENFGVWYATKALIPSGRTFLAEIEGEGDIAVFIYSPIEADFFVGDTLVASGKNVFFVYNGGGIYVSSAQPIEKLFIMALGNVRSAVKPGMACADMNNFTIAYVINQNGTASSYFYIIGSEPVDLHTEGYVQGDVCAYEEGFLFALTDPSGRVDLVTENGNGASYDLGARSVAISNCEDGIYLAYTKKGALYYTVLKKLGDKCSPVRLNYNGSIDELRLTKGGAGLCFSSGGKCYFKELKTSSALSDKLYVTVTKEEQ